MNQERRGEEREREREREAEIKRKREKLRRGVKGEGERGKCRGDYMQVHVH